MKNYALNLICDIFISYSGSVEELLTEQVETSILNVLNYHDYKKQIHFNPTVKTEWYLKRKDMYLYGGSQNSVQ